MLIYFSFKWAIIILTVGFLIGLLNKRKIRYFYLINMISLGAGNMLQRDYLNALLVFLAGVLMAFISKYIVNSFEFSHIGTVIGILAFFIFSLHMTLAQRDLIARHID